MVADSRGYAGYNALIGAKRKIRRLEDGTLIGVSSNQVGFGEAIMDWYAAGANLDATPRAPEINFSMLIAKPNGQVFFAFNSFNMAGPLDAEFYAIGSGEGVATGAMEMGAGPERAIEIACKHDVWSGLPVYALSHRP